MAKELKIEEQFVAYALQKNTVIETGEEVYFIFFQSKLWTHSAQMTKYEFESIFEKVRIKKEETKDGKSCIVENWKIINAIKGEVK